MVGQGKVVGGAFVNGVVSTSAFGSGLVIQSGFRRRKLDSDQVGEWEELSPAGPSGGATAAGAVGRVVAGSVLPGVVGKMASAALDATVSSVSRPQRMVRVSWADGKESLLKLPESLFTHFSIELRVRQVENPSVPTDAALSAAVPPVAPAIEADLIEQIAQLAVLRDQGVLTEEEFTLKKSELLDRL